MSIEDLITNMYEGLCGKFSHIFKLIFLSQCASNTCNTLFLVVQNIAKHVTLLTTFLTYWLRNTLWLTRVQRCCRYLIKSRDEVTYFCYKKAINYEKLSRWKKGAWAKLLILATIATINSVWRSHIQNVMTM